MKNILKKTFIFIMITAFLLPVSLLADTHSVITPEEKTQALTEEIATLTKILKPELIEPLSREEIREVIGNGVDWLKNSQEENGHFAYEYLPYEGQYREDDNIVRQAGTFFALGEIYRQDKEDNYELEENLISAIQYFEFLSLLGQYNGYKFRCIVDREESETCKLGATSLALIGIIDLVETNPKLLKKYESLMNDYVNYILAMKKDGAGFRNNFFTSDNTSTEKESSFFNGEALLALTRYQNLDSKNKAVNKTINDTVDYIDSPAVPFDTALYLWVMAALKELNSDSPSEQYFDYVERYTKWRLEPYVSKRNMTHNVCAYVEGVVSAYSALDDKSEEDLKIYKEEIDFWLAKSALLQLDGNDLVKFNAKKTELFTKAPDSQKTLGGFLTGHSELSQRIDFTQHCLSAYLQTLTDIEKSEL